MKLPARHQHPANKAVFDARSRSDQAVDSFVGYFGSLKYLGWQTVFIIVWVGLNSAAWALRWDPYPWILLNLIFSTQASYAAPLILLSQNRAAEHDRLKAEHDYQVNDAAYTLMQQVATALDGNTKLTQDVLNLVTADKNLTTAIHALLGSATARQPGEPAT